MLIGNKKVDGLDQTEGKNKYCGDSTKKAATNCEDCLQEYNAGLINLENQNYDNEARRQGRYRD